MGRVPFLICTESMIFQKTKQLPLIALVVLVLLGAFAGVLLHVATEDHTDDYHASHQCPICAWYQIGACLAAGVVCLAQLLVQRLSQLHWITAKSSRYIPTLGRAPPIR